MAFTGKTTFKGGKILPEIAEDVSDIVSIVSPYETPLLDIIGDSRKTAFSTYHEWMEDKPLPTSDKIDDPTIESNASRPSFRVFNPDRFRVGDIIRCHDNEELMKVKTIDTAQRVLHLERGYGGTLGCDIENGYVVRIISNPTIEGESGLADRFSQRVRKGNWTQIFSAGIKISGSELAVRNLAVADELDYQKQERLRELLRSLENTVINGIYNNAFPSGSSTNARSMNGIIPSIKTNIFNSKTMISGNTNRELTEEKINLALRKIWENSAGTVDTIVCNGVQKRKINSFITSKRGYSPADTNFRDMVSTYESDFGICRVLLSRHVPENTVLLLDSSKLEVLPLSGRSFHYKSLAATGDYEAGEIIGEYTMEFRNEAAHGMINNLLV